MKQLDPIELQITDLALGGAGVGRHEGRAVFVPLTIPGELVQAQPRRIQRKHIEAELSAVLQPSPHRIEPLCPYYTRCGGCQYQHMGYEEELRWKQNQLEQTLARIGSIQNLPFRPAIAAEPYGYRNRIVVEGDGRAIGFHHRKDARIVDVERCAIASPQVNEKLLALRKYGMRPGRRSLREQGLPERSFHQVNRFLLEPLRLAVVEALDASLPCLIEGYAGSGFFTQGAQERFHWVAAIEAEAKAVEIGRAATKPHVRWICGDVAQELGGVLHALEGRQATLLLDPPREGLIGELLTQLSNNVQLRQLVYLSCNPATLARDLKSISAHWKPAWAQMIDLFPRTAHIECLTILDRLSD